MRINKAAMAYGIVTFCIGIASGLLGKFIGDAGYVVVPIFVVLGSMLASFSIELMTEIKE